MALNAISFLVYVGSVTRPGSYTGPNVLTVFYTTFCKQLYTQISLLLMSPADLDLL